MYLYRVTPVLGMSSSGFKVLGLKGKYVKLMGFFSNSGWGKEIIVSSSFLSSVVEEMD